MDILRSAICTIAWFVMQHLASAANHEAARRLVHIPGKLRSDIRSE
jgi:hypothetical protein